LHFEIREEATEWILNPQLHGFDVVDTISPTVYQIVIYPLNENSFVNNKNMPHYINVKRNKMGYVLPNYEMPLLHGEIGFGIETFDAENDFAARNGTYSIQLFMDGALHYQYKIDKFPFDMTRNINSHIDFAEKKKNNNLIQRCFVEPNNRFPCYKTDKVHGKISFMEDSTHYIKLVVMDVKNNESNLMFLVKGTIASPQMEIPAARKNVKDYFITTFIIRFEKKMWKLKFLRGII